MNYFQYGIIFLITAVLSIPAFSTCNPQVMLHTNAGEIVIELYPQEAPITVDNFLGYVHSGFYDGMLFHRVIQGFMIQTGRYLYYNGSYYYREPGSPIVNESYNGLSNLRGTVAMARLGEDTDGNPQPDSATSQFFINQVDNLSLDRENTDDGYGYCVFGKVISGMDVVDTIAALPVIETWFSEAFPDDPKVGMYSVYVLPCQASYGANLIGSSRIDFCDYAEFASNWLGECASGDAFCGGSDLNYDGIVDVQDLDLVLMHWYYKAGWETEFSDLEPDSMINLEDLSLIATHWLKSGCNESNAYCSGGDIDHDGNVDFVDFSQFSNNWYLAY